MKPIEVRRFRYHLALGALLTLATVAADGVGLLDWLERGLYDARCRHFQYFLRPPSPPLHVDIDVNAIDELGRPGEWPREQMAAVVATLYEAGAEVVALDLLYSDPSEVPTDDQELAEAFRSGRTVVAVELEVGQKRPDQAELLLVLMRVLRSNLHLTLEEARTAVVEDGFDFEGWDGDFGSVYVVARREAMYQRIDVELDKPNADPAEISRRVLPEMNPSLSDTAPLARLFRSELERALRTRQMRNLLRTMPPGAPMALSAANRTPPIRPLAEAASGAGFVHFEPDPGGVVRAFPLWVQVEGKLIPQFGLAAACSKLGVRPADLRLEEDRVIIPRPASQGDLVIPTHRRNFADARGVAYCIDLPMIGTDLWEKMYDHPAHQQTTEHISVLGVYRIRTARERLASNRAVLDKALIDAFRITEPELADNYQVLAPHVRPRDEYTAIALAQIPDKMAELAAIPSPPSEIIATIDLLRQAQSAISTISKVEKQLQALQQQQLDELARYARGRTVFIGYAATGEDFVPTPLHRRCPGVVVQGLVYSAIMSGELWTSVSPWYTAALTLILGFLTTLIVARQSPARGLLFVIIAVACYAAVNGVLMFDYGDLIVGAAGPIVATGLVWSGLTLSRVITEIGERTRITRRFQSYVDPRIVSYVIEHPELVRFNGEVRRMTVVFTDLVGFTTMTEQLGARTVEVLSRYMSEMVPIIRRHRGLVHKFLGDGIMFSFGAPEPNDDQALDAVSTVLEMQRTLERFNQEMAKESFPSLQMRAGISTGDVIVGDSGADDASDYTCLGDAVNLGARLESANKAVGTRNLISDQTAALLGERFLLRPIAPLVVKGKKNCVMTFEPLAPSDEVTDEQRRLAALTRQMVDLYIAGNFEACITAAGQLEAAFGESKLSALYRETCLHHLAEPPEDFCGQIVLTEK